MTEGQLKNGTQLALEIQQLKELRADIGRSHTIAFGSGRHDYLPVIRCKYISDHIGEHGVSITTNHESGAPEWAVLAHKIARMVACDALDAEIEILQKKFDEL